MTDLSQPTWNNSAKRNMDSPKNNGEPTWSTESVARLAHSTRFYSTLLYFTPLYSTPRCSTLNNLTLLCSTLPNPTLLYSTLLHSTLLYSTLLCPALLYSPLRPSTLLCSTLRIHCKPNTWNILKSFKTTSEMHSVTGARTRVARVSAAYPSHLEYGGACMHMTCGTPAI